MLVFVYSFVCLYAYAFLFPHGKISRCPLNQKVKPMISNTGSSKPVQWLTDPYSNSCSTPANKVNLFCLLRVHAAQKKVTSRVYMNFLFAVIIKKLKSHWPSKHTKIKTTFKMKETKLTTAIRNKDISKSS